MQRLLILENDIKLDESSHRYIFNFLKTWEGEIIDFSGLRMKSEKEIGNALHECTHIITQTCFVNGSDRQFYRFVKMLMEIKESKIINIALLGSDLFNYLDSALNDIELISLEHHKIYEYKYVPDCSEMYSKYMDFSARINKYNRKQKQISDYNNSAAQRVTGAKIKVLACSAYGQAFKNIIVGNIYDELDMSKIDPNKNRGVWIMGNGEPIKLVNDCGLQEYEIVSDFNFDVFCSEVLKGTQLNISKLKRIEIEGLLSVLEDGEIGDMEAANFICEETGISKRGNRQIIYNLIGKLRASSEIK